MNRIHVAYHDSAMGEASKLSQKLQAQGWQVFSSKCGNEATGALADALKTFTGPTLLLINDGLLHNLNCQTGMLAAYREIEERAHTHVLLASSMRNGPGNVQARVLTSLDRVSDVIRYMNYWQNAYLIKRRELGATSTPESAQALAPVREVSQEIGEFLKLVRKQKPHSVYDLIDDDGTLLLKLLGTPPSKPTDPTQKADEPIEDSALEPEVPIKDADTSGVGNVAGVAAATGIAATAGLVKDSAKTIENEPPEDVIPEALKADEKLIPEEIPAEESAPRVGPPDLPTSREKITEVIEEPLSTEKEVVAEAELESKLETTDEYIPVSNPADMDLSPEETNVELQSDVDHDYMPESDPSDLDLPVDDVKVKAEEAQNIEVDYLPDNDAASVDAPTEAVEVIDEPVGDAEPTLAELAAKKHKKSRKSNTKQLLKLIEEEELNDAYAFAEESLKADPGNAQLRYYYAVALLRAEDEPYVDVAVHELNKLTQGDYAAEALLCLGHISLERRDYGMARRNLEAAYHLNKKVDSEITYRLGALIQDEYYDEAKEAKKYLKKATKNSKFNKDDAWYRLAQFDFQANKINKARKKLKAAQKASKKHPFAAYDLANMYLRKDDINSAHKYFLKAVYANPELDTEENQAAFSLLRPVEESEGFEASTGSYATPSLRTDAPKVGQMTVLITGASSGIGAATARVFAENGHRLILTGRRVTKLRTLGAELNKEFNIPVRLLSFDVTAFEETEQLLATLPEGWNEIDVLINNAGKAKGLDYIHQGRLEHWEEMIDTNVKGLLYMIRLVSPAMVKRKQGHIINVCSTAGHEVYPKGAVYCATKHAVDAITQGARLDLHRFGIRVSQVSPAHVEETEFAEVRFDGDTDKAEKVYEDFQPLRAHDVAKSIYYIAAQPEHVNVQDVLMLGTQQANSTTIDRSGR